MATQNPIEQEGTYPLPEAQLDRFFFKLVVGYSSREELATIVDRTTRGETIEPDKVMDGAEILQWQQLVREVILAPHVQDYVVRLVLATHPGEVRCAADHEPISPLGRQPARRQTLALAAKVRALLEGRYNVSFEDVRRVYLPALRHRVILNFEAQAEEVEHRPGAAGNPGKTAGEGGGVIVEPQRGSSPPAQGCPPTAGYPGLIRETIHHQPQRGCGAAPRRNPVGVEKTCYPDVITQGRPLARPTLGWRAMPLWGISSAFCHLSHFT